MSIPTAWDDPSVQQAAADADQGASAPNPFGAKNDYESNFWQTDTTATNNVSNSNYNVSNNAYDQGTNDANAYNVSANAYGDTNELSGKISSSQTNLTNNNKNNNVGKNTNRNTNSNTNGVNHGDLDLREENLRRKERELQERQARLNGLQEEIAQSNYREDNWPSKCYAITFHSITQEIPPFARPHMRKMYSLVILTFVALFWNLISILAIFLTEAGDNDTDILWGTVFFVGGIFAAWKLWYRQIYYGLRDRKTLKWWLFFVFFIVHICFSCYMAIGIENGSGAAGFILMFSTLQKNAFAGFCNLIAAVLWTIITLASIFLFKRSWNLYRQRGGLEQARTELTREAAKQVIQNPGLLSSV